MAPDADKPCTQWNQDLTTSLSVEDWENIHMRAFSGSKNGNVQEHCYKLQVRWYRTPAVLHKCFLGAYETCWRCRAAVGDQMHIWCLCPAIHAYWQQGHVTVNKVIAFEFTPSLFLLQHATTGPSLPRKSLAVHIINAARMCIQTHWKSTSSTTIGEWLKRLDKVCELEELIYTTQDKYEKFYETWACWLHFRETQLDGT